MTEGNKNLGSSAALPQSASERAKLERSPAQMGNRKILRAVVEISVPTEEWLKLSDGQLEVAADHVSQALRDVIGGHMPSIVNGLSLTTSIRDEML